jgi:hypothetical protein
LALRVASPATPDDGNRDGETPVATIVMKARNNSKKKTDYRRSSRNSTASVVQR